MMLTHVAHSDDTHAEGFWLFFDCGIIQMTHGHALLLLIKQLSPTTGSKSLGTFATQILSQSLYL